MNKHVTELIFVLDRSGSMEHLTQETIGGFNSLIDRQKSENDGAVYVTTVLFDDRYELLHEHVNIKKVKRLTKKQYYARGCTALLDAVGKTIDAVGERLNATPEDQRPSNILFVITTDGYENASQQYTKSQVKAMIERQQNTYNWNFLFLGAGIDAVSEADSLGIRRDMAYSPSVSARGVETSFRAVSKIAGFMRKAPLMSTSQEEMADMCCQALSEIE